MTPPRDKGAAPAVELAVLDSDMHHLREQADIDRRAEAAFRIETRDQLEKVNLAISTQGATSARIEGKVIRLETDGAKQTELLQDLATAVVEQRTAVRLLAWLLPTILAAIELGSHFWGKR